MKFFNIGRKQNSRQESWIERLNIDTGNWFQFFQPASEGVILFAGQKYPLQFIGSEATSSNTWLWGWENINGFPEKIIQAAMRTRNQQAYCPIRAADPKDSVSCRTGG